MKIYIGGMGRSGTSLISKMFTDLGVNNISKDTDYVNKNVWAGFEPSLEEAFDFIISSDSGILKTPFIYEFCKFPEFNSNNVDLVIIPTRDPYTATMSRLINEFRELLDRDHFQSLLGSSGEVIAGSHYFRDGYHLSENLASSTIMLIHVCTIREIPINFFPFPEIKNLEIQKKWCKQLEVYTSAFGLNADKMIDWFQKNFSEERVRASRKYNNDTASKFLIENGFNKHMNTEAWIRAMESFRNKYRDNQINLEEKVTTSIDKIAILKNELVEEKTLRLDTEELLKKKLGEENTLRLDTEELLRKELVEEKTLRLDTEELLRKELGEEKTLRLETEELLKKEIGQERNLRLEIEKLLKHEL